jgi:diphosphomevalonate decarboxylase
MNLYHQVVVVESSKKKVSSSEAHRRVVSSPLFNGRIARAEMRLADLIYAFEHRDWRKAYETVWAEFWDMHSLFETCPEPFTYMTSESIAALDILRGEVWKSGDGPLITMDAGANIHLLWRPEQVELRRSTIQTLKKYRSLSGDVRV